MKLFPILTGAALALSGMTLSTGAAAFTGSTAALPPLVLDGPIAPAFDDALGDLELAKQGRGRGRGRGGDDRRDDREDRRDDRRDEWRDRHDDSGRSRPRIPGGSGCDDPGDILEHPECDPNYSGGGGVIVDDGNGGGHGGRPRIPGGSGCDDPGDLIEHPECRA